MRTVYRKGKISTFTENDLFFFMKCFVLTRGGNESRVSEYTGKLCHRGKCHSGNCTDSGEVDEQAFRPQWQFKFQAHFDK